MGYKIIIADDHEMFREGLKSLLDKEDDFKVVAQAKDGQDLLDQLAQQLCDIIVLDLSMPKMDGMSALRILNNEYPHIKVLVLTMQKDHEHFKHAMAHGAHGYLLKEEAFDQFIQAIRRLLSGKSYVSPMVATLLTERYIRSLDETETPTLDILTKREQEVLRLIAGSLSNKQIAAQLHLSVRTVETHRANLTNKLGIKSTAALVKYALSKGL